MKEQSREELIQELLAIKSDVEKARTSYAQTQGKLEAAYDQLKKEFGCSSLDEAEALIAQKEAEIQQLEIEITTGIEQLRKEYYESV